MKFSAIAVITAAVAGVGAMPVEPGPLGHLQNRAADAIGGVVSFIRREEVGSPVVPHQLKRASPVRFHNARDVDHIEKRKDGDGKGGNNDVPPLAPFSTKKHGRDIEIRDDQASPSVEKRDAVPDLTKRKKPQESVPPLAPFSTGAGSDEDDE
ncbi:uncharacterized protein CTRU02_211670 [Colletotrichum truncatum]|uniref:Uncharacterized protein n=1 Tax=Colletotrichum truncatum TaxID=5467 RepID=A0ACC3YLM6_COLTU|nr:uncharacterized protein CTRU02_14658 [Colletotrichum truncatum]KAF6781977.1 hypothetical protein CTRU02_14658 [Colletotrichum truncatum]